MQIYYYYFYFLFLLHKKSTIYKSQDIVKSMEKKKRQYQKIGEKDCFNFEMECKFKDVFSATLKI